MSRFTADGSGTEFRLTRRSAIAGGAALVGAAGLGAPASAQAGLVGVIDAVDRWQETDLAGFELRIGGTDGDDNGGGEESSPQGTAGTTQDESGNATVAEGEETVEDAPTQDGSDNATSAGETVEDATAQDGGGGAGSAPQCDYQDWPPDEVAEYDAALIDRKTDQGEGADGSAPEESTTLYVAADEDVQQGEVYLVNSYERCDTDYVGVELEFLGESNGQGSAGADDANENVEDFEAQNNTGNESGGGVGGGGGGDAGSGSGPGFGAVGALVAAAGLGGLLARRRQRD